MRSKVLKRILFWLILALFVGLAIWWSTYFPYRPELLYRAVPLNAAYVGEHDRLAERWQAMARNPLTLGLLESLGVDRAEIDAVLDDPGTKRIVNRLTARKTVMAYVPALGRAGAPAWVVATWVGPYAQFVRWGVFSGAMSEFERIRLRDGRHGWRRSLTGRPDPDGSLEPAPELTLTAVDGMILGCVSTDPTAVQAVLQRVERGKRLCPPLRERLTPLEGASSRREDSAPGLDRGWLTSHSFAGRELSYVLTAHDERSTAGRLKGRADLPPTAALADAAGIDGLAGLLRDTPDALLLAPFAVLGPLLSAPDAAPALQITGNVLQSVATEQSPVFLALLSGTYSGRILGMKVPTLMAGIKVRNGGEALERVTQALDTLNARYGLTLIPRRMPPTGPRTGSSSNGTTAPAAESLIVLDSTELGIYSALGAKEKPAFAADNSWLLFSSNVAALRKLIARRREANAPPGPEAAWRRALAGSQASIYATADLKSTGAALGNAIAVYSLALMVRRSEESADTRARLDQAQAWLDALAPFEAASLWLQPDGPDSQLHFRLGPASPPR